MSGLLARLGVRPRPFRALAASYLLQDLRSQHFARATATRPGETLPPLFWVVGQCVIASGLLAALLFMRVDAGPFAFSGLALSVLLMATLLVVEFHEVVLSPDDVLVVGPRPVPGRTFAAARLANLGFFVLLLTLASNIVPAVLGCALRDSGLVFFPAYLATSLAANTITVGVVILALTWGASYGARESVRDALAWTQIVLILAVFYGAQYLLRDPTRGLERFFARPPSWMHFVPLTWMAEWCAEAAREGITGVGLAAPGGTILLCALLLGLVVLRLGDGYRRVAAGAEAPTATTRYEAPLVGPFARLLGRARPRAAGVALAFALLRRDGDLRMRTLPPLGSVLALVLLGLTSGQLGNPFDADPRDGTVSLAAVLVLVLAVPAMLQNMAFSRDHEAAWLLQTAPVLPGALAQSARLAVCWGIALPLLVVLSLLFAVLWRDPAAAALSMLLGGLQVLATGHGTLRAIRLDLPFARPAARGEIGGPVAPWLAAVATLGGMVSAAVYFAAGRPWPLVGLALVLALAWAASWSLSRG